MWDLVWVIREGRLGLLLMGRHHRRSLPGALGIFALTLVLGAAGSAAQDHNRSQLSHSFVQAALERTRHSVRYDASYRVLGYPGGDVPPDVGVCTDLVIRAYRKVGIDLQKELHEDMTANFSEYPNIWGLIQPDPNIDHRRVPNLRVFFRRKGAELPVTSSPDDYSTGDIVTWVIPGNLPHIGIVVDRESDEGTPMVVHNIGRGPELEDILFSFPITGHYRYFGLTD